jgi:hypothetical protein
MLFMDHLQIRNGESTIKILNIQCNDERSGTLVVVLRSVLKISPRTQIMQLTSRHGGYKSRHDGERMSCSLSYSLMSRHVKF